MMINKITPTVDFNMWFKHLDTQPTHQNSIKVPKVVKPTNKKNVNLNFGVIISPLSSSSLDMIIYIITKILYST